MKDCNNCKHKDCWEYADPCNSCTDVNDTRKPTNWEAQTNADRIRAMTDEEMAEEIKAIIGHCANGFCGKGCPLYSLCYLQGITELDWLKQEASE